MNVFASSPSSSCRSVLVIHTSPTLIVELYKTGSPLFRRPRGLVTSDLDNACKKAQLLNKRQKRNPAASSNYYYFIYENQIAFKKQL